MSSEQRRKVAYGLSQPYFNVGPIPIVASRVPTTSDFAEIGTMWIDEDNNTVWVISQVISNQAIWVEIDNSSASLGLNWTTEAGAAIGMTNNHGYYLMNAGPIACTLPVVSAVGSQIWLISNNSTAPAAGITIMQNAGQSLRYDNETSTIGVGGSMAWIGLGDGATPLQLVIQMVCTVANSEWSIVNTIRVPSAVV